MCLSVLKHASAKYATNAFSSKMKDEKLVAWFTFSKKHRIWSFRVAALQRTAKKCTKIYNARAQPLFCSLRLLFVDVLVAVAVAVVFCVRVPNDAQLPTCALGQLGQTIATCQHSISQHCWAQHVAFVWPLCCDMLRHVGCCWLKFDQFQT